MQQNQKWKVISTGFIKEGFIEDNVISNIQKAFSVSQDSARNLVNGRKTVLKQDISQADAYKYKIALENAGLTIILERMPASVSATQFELEPVDTPPHESHPDSQTRPALAMAGTTEATDQPLGHNQMACPKCGHVQVKSAECSQCGIIISRYIEKTRIERLQKDNPDFLGSKQNDIDKKSRPIQHSIFAVAITLAICSIAIYMINRPAIPPLGSTKESAAEMSAYRLAKTHEAPDINYIRELVNSEQFSQVEFILNELNENVKTDISWEEAYNNTIARFSPSRGFDLNKLHKWVKQTDSAYAYLARGAYYNSVANKARGTCYASCVTKEQFETEREFHKLALEDLFIAKSMNNKILPVYHMIFSAARSQNTPIPYNEILNEAVSNFPGGFYYRLNVLYDTMPKWGGSYYEMENFIKSTQPYISYNPRLWLLSGYISGEMAQRSKDNGQYEKCVSQYTDALKFGVDDIWLRFRASCLTQLGEYEQALQDINISLEMYDDPDARELKDYILYKI